VIFVVDASVAVKWTLPGAGSEEYTEEAVALLAAIEAGVAEVLQPPHWLLEVAAVLVRLWPEATERIIERLELMNLATAGDGAIIRRATRLAQQLDHHLFDTMYHAVALERGGVLVTADGRYARKARHLGSVVELRHWSALSVEPS
jgi:predicted nucleic acid-binding protein